MDRESVLDLPESGGAAAVLRLVGHAGTLLDRPFEEQQEIVRQTQELGLEGFGRRGSGPGFLSDQLVLESIKDLLDLPTHSIQVGELVRLGWKESDLAARQKNDPAKLAMAARLHRATTLPIKGIAAWVQLGTSKSANARLHRAMRAQTAADAHEAQLGI